MAISSMRLVPLDAAESVPAEASWPRSPPWPRPWKSCLRATLDTLLEGKLRPRALVMAEVMALVMAVWIWLLRAEMRMAPIILRKMCWGCRYKIVVMRMLLTENVVFHTCLSQLARVSLSAGRSQPWNFQLYNRNGSSGSLLHITDRTTAGAHHGLHVHHGFHVSVHGGHVGHAGAVHHHPVHGHRP